MSLSNDSVESLLSSLSLRFDYEDRVKYSNQIDKMLNGRNDDDLFPNPYEFYNVVRHKFGEDSLFNDSLLGVLFDVLAEYHNLDISVPADYYTLKNFYIHYDLLSRHLTNLIHHFEGRAFSADKSHNLISQVSKKILDNTSEYVISWSSLSAEIIVLYEPIAKEIYNLTTGRVENYIKHYHRLEQYYADNIATEN